MSRLAFSAAVAAAGAGAAIPAGAVDLVTQRYLCERGVEVPVAYVTAAEGSAAVLTVEGRQIALLSQPTGSGVRYGWPSDGSGYVWLTKGDEAMLLWRDGAAGTEATLLGDCRAAG